MRNRGSSWYGLSRQNFFHTLQIFGLLGVIAAVLAVLDAFHKGQDIQNWWRLLGLVLGIPMIWTLLGIVLSSTWLKLDEAEVSWYLWKRFLLLRCPVRSILTIGSGGFSAMIIKTSKGTIYLFGLHFRDRVELTNRLMEVNPNIQLALP
jgi:hypothetical protein